MELETLTEEILDILEEMDEYRNELVEELTEINSLLVNKIYRRKGEFYFTASSEEEAMLVNEIYLRRQEINGILNFLPSKKEIKSLIYLIEHKKEIKQKQYNIFTNLKFDLENEYNDLFMLFFKKYNYKINLHKIINDEISQFKTNLEQILVDFTIKTEDDIVDINEVINEEKVKTIVKEVKKEVKTKKELSTIASNYYNLLMDSNNYNQVFLDLKNMVNRNDYKVINELNKIFKNEYFLIKKSKELNENNDEYEQMLIEIWNKLILLDEVIAIKPEEILIPKTINQPFLARTNLNNIYIKEDLKSIPKEYYDSAKKLIEALLNNNFSGLENKKFTSNNKLENLWEVKIYKVRLFYLILGNNNVQLLMISMKKSQNDKLLTDRLKQRLQITNENYNYLKQRIINGEITQTEIQEENMMLDEILNTLSTPKKSKTK